jgi:hypothetical protein
MSCFLRVHSRRSKNKEGRYWSLKVAALSMNASTPIGLFALAYLNLIPNQRPWFGSSAVA